MPLTLETKSDFEKFKLRGFKVKDLIAAGRQAVAEVSAKSLDEYATTVRTWEHETSFWVREAVNTDGVKMTFFTDNDKYNFIDRGTTARFAHMTPDFKAKTKVDWISSRAGAGGFAYLGNPLFQAPLPGIVARNFSDIVAKRAGSRLNSALTRLLYEWLETGKIAKTKPKTKVTHMGLAQAGKILSSIGHGLTGISRKIASQAGRTLQANVGKAQKRK